MAVRKNFKLLKYEHIIYHFKARDPDINFKLLKYEHIIYHFKARDLDKLFREIFKFRENTSKNRFREISLNVHKIAKFNQFAKVITYSKSPDYLLQSYV